MKVKMTEIECTAEEIKASNSLAEGVLNALRNVFNSVGQMNYHDEFDNEIINEEEEEDE